MKTFISIVIVHKKTSSFFSYRFSKFSFVDRGDEKISVQLGFADNDFIDGFKFDSDP